MSELIIPTEKIILILKLTEKNKISVLQNLIEYIKFSNEKELIDLFKVFDGNPDDKMKFFNILHENNKLLNLKTNNLNLFDFLTNNNLLNWKTDVSTLKIALSISPCIIFEMLDYLKGKNKSDDMRIELIQYSNKISDFFTKFKSTKGDMLLAEKMSSYFISYDKYTECCEILNIDFTIYSIYDEKMNSDGDTIIIFDESLKFSEMTCGKFYSFEKLCDHNLNIIINIKKSATNQRLCVEKYYITENKFVQNYEIMEGVIFNKRGLICNENNFCESIK